MKDTHLAIYAMVNLIAVLLSQYGIIYGMYAVMALLSISTFNIVVGSAAALNFVVDLEDIKKQYEEMEKPSLSLLFMTQVIYGVSIVTMYKLGFVFISGIFAVTISIGMIGTILKALSSKEKSKE